MAFLAPLFAGALGLGAVGTALVSAGISLALGFVARALGPKPSDQGLGPRGMRLTLRLDPNAERELVFGTAATAGTLAYRGTYGGQNRHLQLVFVLADHECESLEEVWVDGKKVTWNSLDGSVDEFPDVMTLTFHNGAYDQAADAALVANSDGAWTSNDRGRGVCYVMAHLKFAPRKYPQGPPAFVFVIKGAKLYDWRKDSTNGGTGTHRWGTPSTYEWSDNPALELYNYRRGIFVDVNRIGGMATPAVALPVADWTAAANACDETVALKAGGSEKRYRCNGVVTTSQTHGEVIRQIVSAAAGREIDSGGTIRFLPGVSAAPVLAFTDDDLMAAAAVSIERKHPRSELVNAVFGSYHDPVQMFEGVALPPRVSPADEATDGGVRLERHYALDFVTSQTQGQRVLEILRRRGRRQTSVQARLRSRFSVLEAGDWVTWTSARYGWTNKTFEVASAAVSGDDLTTQLTLVETDANVYAWTPASDELDVTAPPAVPAGNNPFVQLSGLAVASILVSSGSTSERPGLQATWTPVDDETVTELLIEYRRQGDTVALQRSVKEPAAGEYTWVDGVQGGTTYEIRADLVTVPARDTLWTSWVATSAVTDPQVVEVGSIVNVPPNDSIGPEHLSAQTRFELGLITALESVAGSVNARVEEAIRIAREAAAAALGAVSTQGRQLRQVRSQGDGTTLSVTEILESVDGIHGRWGIAIDVDGRVVGLVNLDGSNQGSQFTVLADKFVVGNPGDPSITPFVVSPEGIVLDGVFVKDGSVTAAKVNVSALSAITADVGEVTAGLMRSADNLMRIDLDAGTISIATEARLHFAATGNSMYLPVMFT